MITIVVFDIPSTLFKNISGIRKEKTDQFENYICVEMYEH